MSTINFTQAVINQQIIEPFWAYQENTSWTSISGLTFSKTLWINGVSANASAISISEDSKTGGVYYLTYTPSVTGSHYINLYSPSAVFDVWYYVTSGAGYEIWTDSGTGVLNNINVTGVTANVDYNSVAESVWSYSSSGLAVTAGSMGYALSSIWQIQVGKWVVSANNRLILYDYDGTSVIREFNLYDINNNPSITGVVKRIPI